MAGARREWRPPFATHVAGWYFDREVGEDGLPEEAEVGAECEHAECAREPEHRRTFRRRCASGNMRGWIARFAMIHMHKDHFNERLQKPGEGGG